MSDSRAILALFFQLYLGPTSACFPVYLALLYQCFAKQKCGMNSFAKELDIRMDGLMGGWLDGWIDGFLDEVFMTHWL